MDGKKIYILGNEWVIKEQTESENAALKDCSGYCDWTVREIVLDKEITGNLTDMDAYKRKVLRHEIIHAFLCECGLDECSSEVEAWARNEEMVDWFARMGDKIHEVWKEVGAI